jgi:outer membrane protein OmpA-like peptidoglycan-associated protein
MRKSLLLSAILLVGYSSIAQSTKELAAGYYTVVAAYDNDKEEYAQRYAKALQEKGHAADYGFNTSRHLFFVFVTQHTNLTDALKNMYALRKKGEFTDSWVRVVPGVIGQAGEPAKPAVPVEAQVVTETPKPVTIAEKNPESVKEERKPEPPAVVEKPMEIAAPSTTEIEQATVTEEIEEKIIQHSPITLGNTDVFLSLFNASNNRIVDGDVMIIDTDRGRLLKTVKGNEYTTLPDPKNQSGKVTLICDVFGYRKMQHELNYKKPEADTALAYFDMMGLSFVMTFDLVRYRKGDVQTLSHVYFYNDAAIMLPESRYEINILLQMMTESPTMKVRLRGHANGNYHGKIIKMGQEKSFFAIAKDAVSTVGTAKDLSYERAEIIKEYLVANNISEDRIEVKGFGGKKPLYDKHSANAKKNVRVEVEVLAE